MSFRLPREFETVVQNTHHSDAHEPMASRNNDNIHPTGNTKPGRHQKQHSIDDVPLIDASFPRHLQRKRRLLSKETTSQKGFQILCCCGNYLTLHSSFNAQISHSKSLSVESVLTSPENIESTIETKNISDALTETEETVHQQQIISTVRVKTEPIENQSSSPSPTSISMVANSDTSKTQSVLIKLTNLRRNIQSHHVRNLFRNFLGIQKVIVQSSPGAEAGTGIAIAVLETSALANELLDYLKAPGVVDYHCEKPVKGEALSQEGDSFLDVFVKIEKDTKPPLSAVGARQRFSPNCNHSNRTSIEIQTPDPIRPSDILQREREERHRLGKDDYMAREKRGGRFGGNPSSSASYQTNNERRSAENVSLRSVKRKSSNEQEDSSGSVKSAKRDGWLGLALNEFLKSSRSPENDEAGTRNP
jgi:hypothetical protein